MNELRPCPFCSSDNVRIAVTMHESWYYGECESCGGRTDFYDSQAEAIGAWNTRAECDGVNGETSDGYHTFNELYHHRAVLFSVIVANYRDISWKSKLHHDGTMYEDMFIVGVDTPQGQATYHCDMEYWNIFWCKELERAPEWDGHTPDDAIERIGTLAAERTCKQVLSDCDDGLMPPFTAHCSACGDEWGFTPKYCPNCGRKVVNE